MESDKNQKVLINRSTLTSIGNAIRNKSGSETTYTPSEMPSAINTIKGGTVSNVESLMISNKADLAEIWLGTPYQSLPLQVQVLPEDAPQIVQVTVSDSSLCGVRNNGDGTYSLRPYKNGTVNVTVSDYSGQITDSFAMNIGTRITKLTMSSAVLELQVGIPRQLSCTLEPASTTERGIVWSSSDPESASVDQNGVVTAHKHCSDVTITATSASNSAITTTCKITAYIYDRDPDWAAYRAAIKNGTIKELVDVGDVIVDTWTDTVANKEYEYSWIVADFRKVTLEDGSEVDAMYLMSKNSLPWNLQFAQGSKLKATEEVAQEGVFYYGNTGSTYTLLTISDGEPIPYDQYTNIYKTKLDCSKVPANAGSRFNDAATYGLNRWKFSAARQFLNSATDAGNWFESQFMSDICSYANSRAGFLSGFSAAFQDALVPVKVQTVLNTTIYNGETDVTYDKMFLPSTEEVYMGAYSSTYNGIEGEAWAYYKKMATSPTTSSLAARAIIPLGSTSANYSWLRSAYLSYTYTECLISYGGSRTNNSSNSTYRFAPACAITAS